MRPTHSAGREAGVGGSALALEPLAREAAGLTAAVAAGRVATAMGRLARAVARAAVLATRRATLRRTTGVTAAGSLPCALRGAVAVAEARARGAAALAAAAAAAVAARAAVRIGGRASRSSDEAVLAAALGRRVA